MEIFRWNESKSRVPLTSQRDFQEAFVKGKRPQALKSGIHVPLTGNLEFC